MTTTVTLEGGALDPQIPRIVTTSTLAQVTTAGWLNSSISEGFVFPADSKLLIAHDQGAAAASTDFFNISVSAGIYTLSLTDSAVILPTIANHLAVFKDAAGTLTEDVATAIQGGNLQAGLSGTAGTVASFPATAAKGSFVLKAVANTGNTLTTLSNDAMGQASVINIPDPGNAIGQLLIGATATPLVSGNFPQNSGTAGLVVDSGVSVASISAAIASVSGAVTQLGTLQQVNVTLNTAAMAAAYANPAALIANPGANKVILVLSASVYVASTGNTAYATGTSPIIQYSSGGTNGAHGAGTLATATGLVAGDITAAASQVRNLLTLATGAQTGLSNLGIYFSNATGAYTAGTGTNVTFSLVYLVLTATI